MLFRSAVFSVLFVGFDGSFELVPQVLVKVFELCSVLQGLSGCHFSECDVQFQVVSFVGKEWGYSCGGVSCIVVGKLS